MKKRRLAFLLTAVLSVACIFSACGGSSTAMKDYFEYDTDVKSAYSSVTRLDGELCKINEQHNLIALETEEVSPAGYKSVTIKVVNALTGTTLISETEYFNDNVKDFSVELDKYPLITFVTEVEEIKDDYPVIEYYYDYYLIKVDTNTYETLGISTEDRIERYSTYENSVMTFSIGSTTYWVNKKGEIIRELLSAVTETYGNPSRFYAEFNDYLYDWVLPGDGEESKTSYRIQVFNKAGICSVQYIVPATVFSAKAFVLNNGNIFIQEFENALNSETHNYLLDMGGITVNANVKSKIINYQSGEVTELDLGFIVQNLESAYNAKNDTESSFPFTLTEGLHNQAIVIDFDVTGDSPMTRYVVLDNLMNVQYELVNQTLSSSRYWVKKYLPLWLGEKHYVSSMVTSEEEKIVVFDLDGNLTFEINANVVEGFAGEYIVAENAIYSANGKMVYDFADLIAGASEEIDIAGVSEEDYIEIVGNNVYLYKKNHVTGCIDTYSLDLSKKKVKPVLVSEGINTEFRTLAEGVVLYDLEMGVSSFMSQDGTVLLKVKGRLYSRELSDVVIVEDVVDGESVCYVIK